ncbi:hypothetical protein CHLRE_10g463968v5 [Chlamydomonas reinhardtii]|uniref:Uncharacterized protein n=1 Tax=Chlamydomonas reinhardtii TaxID=3055 RepID=A0A2K3DC44_CHLRE|nr:uncharacterized protein CHLRE_10g463968v5 [Chlamydomonas reinhardtii]PNW78093.1 hypothetical protein CHLRE_10g463968v5 [Chlamydomonas reinhardtii]
MCLLHVVCNGPWRTKSDQPPPLLATCCAAAPREVTPLVLQLLDEAQARSGASPHPLAAHLHIHVTEGLPAGRGDTHGGTKPRPRSTQCTETRPKEEVIIGWGNATTGYGGCISRLGRGPNRALLRLLVDKYAHLVVYVDVFHTSQGCDVNSATSIRHALVEMLLGHKRPASLQTGGGGGAGSSGGACAHLGSGGGGKGHVEEEGAAPPKKRRKRAD